MNHDILQMYAQLFSLSLSHYCSTIFLLLFITTFSTSQSEDHEMFSECRNQTYNCGQNIKGIGYPYWGDGRPQYCGHPLFQLKCQNNDYPVIDIDDHTFRVLGINSSGYTITMARLDLWDNHCPQTLTNITLNTTFFGYPSTVRNLYIFYNCTSNFTIDFVIRNNFTCDFDGSSESNGFYADESFLRIQLNGSYGTSCEDGIEVSVLKTSLDGLWNGSVNLQKALNLGFEVIYNTDDFQCAACETSGGTCGFNLATREFVCFCHDQPHRRTCQDRGHKLNLGLKFIIGFCSVVIGILLMGLPFYFYHRRNKKLYTASRLISRNNSSYSSSMVDLDQPGTYLGLQIFSYSELEEATKKFDSEKILGDGGFGIVYLGKLKDGRAVAVKRLYENSYKRVEQFMNEIEILSRLRHQNLVSLYGCTSRHCRELILVYEYISNGTVADHLHGEGATPGSLAWTTRMSIAIETATALAYLHASDVIHRDVKTNNILLDNNFCVKVADFGLSRLYPTDVTHVSTAPQGTPGYVDPEYHDCYHLTKESDVYSFGVVLIELISSMPAVDITRKRHEINLSHLAISKIQSNALHELVDPSIGFESDYKVKNMVTDVAELAFQCLQNEREMRPSMEEVLEALIGIQRRDDDIQKTSIDIPADDVVLLKNNPPTLSPDSVTTKWISTSTSDFSG
ncbi:LEAF RUST 10 DISEASE-RESISTANCE LOCUS RECEPTOR-LIKE PROTEIN KINASE-like 1.2 isoform X1 [Cornus florida]|uniref:LEAF RUST 10 DISEASE-RESISTANCE LOCUS RECEPTOR-LIKE PROTEIN KINASE-like 1.2 isoform X1 n=1 Tax=Cornus florida TaxID=4283 RepID=UPI00289876B5|nr:LEAF RUST 10 DISEASE-RESISTANCE LOCUS RECEPTOR-LIKE PROTEIN KINASE-like 1.2 isoform X1 [Cornus florida]